MAPSKRIAPETPPETLPEDFFEWEDDEGKASPPADAQIYQSRTEAPAATQRAQTPAAIPPPRVPERPKPMPGRPAPDADLEVDAFLKRLNEVSSSRTEPVPVRRQEPIEAPKPRAAAAPEPVTVAPRQEPPAPAKPMGVEQELIQVFRSGYKEVTEPAPENEKKTNWAVIGTVGALVVALGVGIPFYMHSRHATTASAATSSAATTPSTTQVTDLPKPSPVGTTNTPANTTAQQQAAQAQQAYDNPALNQPPVSSALMNQQLTASSQLPQGARSRPTQEAPPPNLGVGLDAMGGNSSAGNLFRNQPTENVRVSPVTVSAGVAGGMLIRKVAPSYPAIAKTARVSGTVVLAATITRTGRVENLRVISGPVMLQQAAIDAVRNWLYRPYMLDNQPTEVQTTISVDFSL